ncbi:phospho-N-acetylmuramoyl-pentapeptide-transferase homolog isoform X2 [Phoenix dactylifera]|uniref:Phospho-N-acetylmuramoyl-pentapeptide- transferase homolog isoform X2 n=1 Tax=Phoenix dactylifera TaxID=42345 RepID=A0A8B9A491_PHODC|nr:phospho-N-acetylmuramoyl-pentapeptide-transferase homolog isoform X2 [Phoenix dactylifera]
MSSANPHFVRLGFEKPQGSFSSPTATRSLISSPAFRSGPLRSGGFKCGLGRCSLKRFSVLMLAIDENSMAVCTVIEESNGISGGKSSCMPSSSDGGESDTELLVYPSVDVDLPINKDRVETPDPSLAVAGHHVATLQQGRRKRRVIVGGNSIQLNGAAVATFAFAIIGLLDDLLSCIKSHNYGLPGWVKLSLQVAVGAWFSFWLDSSNISTPYSRKWLVPLPPPFGLVSLGKFYLILTAFCFAAMGNGVNLTDGLDGLAGGSAALAFVGMSVTVLAICPELAVFGASMAGACIGFLFHNRYKASIFMGDTGSLALGGALAAMAACTGMFFPLFIASGIFVMEVLSVIIQVLSVKITKRLYGTSRRVFRMAPVHHHFELCGLKEPIIVASAYVISYILALLAGYIGLISA